MGYPQPQYPPPQYQAPYQPVVASTSGWAIASLIFAILGWLGMVGIGGLAAVICGHIAKGEINGSYGRIGGGGMATVGLVLGYLNIILGLIGLCLLALSLSGAIICPFFFMDPSYY